MYITKPFNWKGVTSCMVVETKAEQERANSFDLPIPSYIQPHVRYVLRVAEQRQTEDGPVYQCQIESFPSTEIPWSGDIAANSTHDAMFKLIGKLTELVAKLVRQIPDDWHASMGRIPSVSKLHDKLEADLNEAETQLMETGQYFTSQKEPS